MVSSSSSGSATYGSSFGSVAPSQHPPVAHHHHGAPPPAAAAAAATSPAATGDETLDEEADVLRGRCYKVCVAITFIAALHCGTFWTAYGWAILLIAFAFALAGLGLAHFGTMLTLQTSTCAFAPLDTVANFGYSCVLLIAGGALSVLTSIVALTETSGPDWMVALIVIALINSVAYVVAGGLGLMWGRGLYQCCVQMEVMCPPQWIAQPIEATAVEGTVVIVSGPRPIAAADPPAPAGAYGVASASHPAGFDSYPPLSGGASALNPLLVPPAPARVPPPAGTHGGAFYGSPGGFNGDAAYTSGYTTPRREPSGATATA